MKKALTFYLLIVCVCWQSAACFSQENPALIYLNDKREFEFSGNQREVEAITIKRSYELLIVEEVGTKILSTYYFPEPIDPIYYDIAPEIKQHHFHLDIHKVDHFSLRIKRGNSYLRSYENFENFDRKKFLKDETAAYATSTTRTIDLPMLKVGDVIKVDYQITLFYDQNKFNFQSFRIFFHDHYPKEKSEIRIKYSTDFDIEFNYPNFGEPSKSFGKEQKQDKWTMDYTAGALADKNGHPAGHLPHIEIFIDNNQPLWPFEYRLTSHNIYSNQQSINVGSRSKQYQILNQFLASKKITHPEDVIRLFNHISMDFKYDNDSSFYSGERLFDEPRFGNDLVQKRLRETNKFALYSNILSGLDMSYTSVMLADKRIGTMSKSWLQPQFLSDFLFMPILDDERVLFLYPKDQQEGYFVNELPFYFEDTQGEVIPLSLGHNKIQGDRRSREYLLVQTPINKTDSNTRKTIFKLKFDESSKTILVSFSQELKGQFSTMMRPIYTQNEKRRFVDEMYHEKLWDNLAINNLMIDSVKVSNLEPFTVSISGKFELLDQSFNQLVKHLTVSGLSQNRSLPFYPDFAGTDSYEINAIGFDKDLIDRIPSNIYLANSFGRHIVRSEKKGDIIKIVSSFSIKSKELPPNQIQEPIDLYKSANSMRFLE